MESNIQQPMQQHQQQQQQNQQDRAETMKSQGFELVRILRVSYLVHSVFLQSILGLFLWWFKGVWSWPKPSQSGPELELRASKK